MSTEMLIAIVVLETTAAIILATVNVTLLVRLRTRTRSNRTLIEHGGDMLAEVSESKRRETAARQELEACRSWYRTTLDSMSEIVLVHGLDAEGFPGPLLEANEAACVRLGLDRETLLTRTITDFLAVDLPSMGSYAKEEEVGEQQRKMARKVVWNMLDQAMRGKPVRSEDSLRNAQGQSLHVQLTALRSDLLDQPTIVWIGQDMSEIREGQRAAQESQKRMEDFFSHSPLGIAIFGADRNLVTVNRACLHMFGMPDPYEFERFDLFQNPFLPRDAKEALGRGESVQCDMAVDFDEVRRKAVFASHRRDRGHFEVLISNLGYAKGYQPRGYFAQIQDVSQRRRIEAELRRLQTAKASADGISGSLEDVSLVDIVQVFCAGGRNMEISITDRRGKAQVYMQGGAIVHCVVGERQGEEAFYELMRWKQGTFTAKPCPQAPAQTITGPAMGLLMEGARRLDEVPVA